MKRWLYILCALMIIVAYSPDAGRTQAQVSPIQCVRAIPGVHLKSLLYFNSRDALYAVHYGSHVSYIGVYLHFQVAKIVAETSDPRYPVARSGNTVFQFFGTPRWLNLRIEACWS